MRESQKMRLDVRLHTKIIDSIIRIQLWFRGILRRRKSTNRHAAAITIQSYWRMYVAHKQYQLKKSRIEAVILIQATWRMFVTRKWFNRLRKGVVIVQAHIRGKLARISFNKAHRQVNKFVSFSSSSVFSNQFGVSIPQKVLKERNKLRPTQSLPAHERSIDVTFDRSINIPYHSFDSDIHNPSKLIPYANRVNENLNDISLLQHRHVLHRAENQFRTLMINSAPANCNKDPFQSSTSLPHHDYQNLNFTNVDLNQSINRQSDESVVDSRGSRFYDVERATKHYYDDIETSKR